ncbi:MAG: DUF2441 domain-containing protein [Clostridia bacterium]|nr:DUF2441 domain-containing protein [Clostridia bacterium]
MEVKDLILYQVATDRNYKVGDKINFNNTTTNGQYNRVYNTKFTLNGNRASDEMYRAAKRKFRKFKHQEDVYEIAHKLEAYDVCVKELALEQVRLQRFKELPSRLHCMYLSLNKEIALQNIESMASNREKLGKHFQAVAVKLNGKIFKAGRVYMSREGESFAHYLKKAEEYWSQSNLKDEEIKEILFEGEAEIIEILKEIKHD